MVLSHSIELLLEVEGNDGNLALDGEGDGLFHRRHGDLMQVATVID